MPSFVVTHPDGRKLKLTGDAPPVESEVEEIFNSMASETTQQIKADPEFEPSVADRDAAYNRRFSVDLTPTALGQGALELGRQIFVDLPKQFAQQEQERIDRDGKLKYILQTPGRGMRTGVEAFLQGAAGLGGLLKAPLQMAADETAAAVMSPGDEELRKQMWLDRVRAAGEEGRAVEPYLAGEKSIVPGAQPAFATLASNVLDPSVAVPAGAAAKIGKNAVRGARAAALAGDTARAVEMVAEEAARKGPALRTAAGAAAPVVEKAAELTGQAAAGTAKVIDAVQPVADVAGMVTGGVAGLGATHAGGRAASAVLRWSSKVRDSGTALRSIAKADWSSAQPIYAQLAKDADAPVWLRRVSSSAVAPLVEGSVRASGELAKGAATGAAIGAASAANDTLTPEEKGGAVGAGAAFGVAGAGLGRAAGGQIRAEVRQGHDIAVRMDQAIKSGADPLAVLGASDAVMFYADNVERLFKGAMPGGKDLQVVLQDKAQFDAAGRPGVAAFEMGGPDGQPRVVVNVEAAGADARTLHEAVGHALAESVVTSQPQVMAQVRAAVDRAAGGDPAGFLQRASEQYATALLGQDPQAAADYIQQRRARSAELYGDQDAWILGEIWAEAAVRAVGGRSVLDLATPGFFGRVSRLVAQRMPGTAEALERFDSQRAKPQFDVSERTFFQPDVAAALDDTDLQSSITTSLRDLGNYRPGIDPAQERGVKVATKDVGTQPYAQLHDLGGGARGTDFVQATPDGRVVAVPPAEVRRKSLNRRKFVDTAVPREGVPVAPETDRDPTVKLRRTISGQVERSGTKLGNWFYASKVFSETTKQIARSLEDAIANGTLLSAWYHQIGDSLNWKGSVEKDYGNVEAQFKDFVPIGFAISKPGNLLVRNYSVSSFNRKAAAWSARKGPLSLELWNGDVGQFTADTQTYLRNHAEGRPGADGIGEQKRDLINAFMVGGNRTFEAKNPLRASLRGQDAAGLVRSYRLDRLEPVSPSELKGWSQPAYEKQVRNLSPDVQFSPAPAPETPEFKKWFGKSKVTDENGAPRVVYHGTSKDFTSFDPEMSKDIGIHFGTAEQANRIADSGSWNGAKLIPAYLRLENPLRVKDTFSVIRKRWISRAAEWSLKSGLRFDDAQRAELYDAARKADRIRTRAGGDWTLGLDPDREGERTQYDKETGRFWDVVERAAKAQGYDGFVYSNKVEGKGDSYAVFSPEQVKSAIGNRGTFDANNPDVQFSPDVTADPSDPGAIAVEYVKDKKGEPVLVKGEPKTIQHDYNFLDAPLVSEIINSEPDPAKAKELLFGRKGIRTKLNTSTLTNRKPLTPEENALYQRITDRYADAFVEDYKRYKDDPDVMAARGWYSDVSDFVKNLIPDPSDRSHFLEFLGGTSPNTDVETNYLYALDLFNRWKSGDFDGLVDRYQKVTTAHRAGELIPSIATQTGEGPKTKYRLLKEKRSDFIATYMANGMDKADAIALAAKPGRADLLGYFLLKENALPLREGGGKYGFHSDRIIQILSRRWISESDAPKAPNFTGNLDGSRRTATIDVWAARFLRRVGYENKAEGPWRIQPMSESGVQNYDFFFGQDVFDKASKQIEKLDGRPTHADDMQAIMWFAEKREWARRGWSKSEDLGDFRQYLYKTTPAGEGRLKIKDGELSGASENFLKTLSPGQFENVRLRGPEAAATRAASSKVREAEQRIAEAPDEDRRTFWKKKLEERRAAARQAFSSEVRFTR